MKGYIHRAFDALERASHFVTHDVWRIGQPGETTSYGFVVKHVRVVVLLIQGLIKDALLLRAAALTFTTMLAIVPLLIVVLFFVSTFDLEEDIYGFLGRQIFRGVAQPDPETQLDAEDLAILEEADNATIEAMADPVQAIVDFAKEGADPRSLGVLGFLFVVLTVFGLMNNIESSFNQIWGLRRTRSYYRKFTDYIVVLAVLPFVVIGMLSANAVLQSQMFDEGRQLYGYLIWILNYAMVWAAFTAMYYFIPNTKVKLRYAILGGIVAGTLWNFASWGYVTFQFGAPRYKLLYQTFAQVPVLLMWIYVSWVILLLGAELTFAYQNEKTYAMERLAAGASHAYREAVGLRAMLEIARRFDRGEPNMEPAEAAERWKVPTRLLNDMLDQLAHAGLLRPCATDPITFQPSRSIERITLGDVIRAIREEGQDPSSLSEDEGFRPLLEAINGSSHPAMEQSLASLVRNPEAGFAARLLPAMGETSESQSDPDEGSSQVHAGNA